MASCVGNFQEACKRTPLSCPRAPAWPLRVGKGVPKESYENAQHFIVSGH